MPRAPDACLIVPLARSDLESIWTYTATNWSPDQADRYIAGLAQVFETLASNPEIARERTEFDPPVRVYKYRSHLVFYRVDERAVVVLRVLHGRQDWRRLLE